MVVLLPYSQYGALALAVIAVCLFLMLLENPQNCYEWLLEFNPQAVRSPGTAYRILLHHSASIIISCIWKHTHTCIYIWIWLLQLNFSLVENLEHMSGFVRSETMTFGSSSLNYLTAFIYCFWARLHPLSFCWLTIPTGDMGKLCLYPTDFGEKYGYEVNSHLKSELKHWTLLWRGWDRGSQPHGVVKQKHRTKGGG